MATIRILVIGRHPDILETVVNLINKNTDWSGTGVLTDQEAITSAEKNEFNIILLTNGIDDCSEQILRRLLVKNNPEAILIQHYGGGSGLLYSEILHALNNRKQINTAI